MDARRFRAWLKAAELSQAKLAEAMSLEPSAVSRMLTGEREMRMAEAAEIARLLGVPLPDILRAAGIDIDRGERNVPVVGYIDGVKARIDWRSVAYHVTGPWDMPRDAVAIQMRTAATPLAHLDGWLVFIRPPGDGHRSHNPDHAGRWCVVQARGGDAYLGQLRRGYMPDRWNLYGMPEPLLDVEIAWSTPVLWIKPS